MDHVALFNELIKVIKVVGGKEAQATSKDDSISDSRPRQPRYCHVVHVFV
jgi:hypothetical protein